MKIHFHFNNCKRKKKIRFDYSIGRPEKKEQEHQMLELKLTNEEKILVTVNPVTSTGRPAAIDGAIEATIQSGEGTVEIQPDGRSFYLVSGDDPGDTAVLVSADSDLGSGVETVSDVVLLHVEGAKAANLGLSAGAPQPK